jgi:hypothetical protein
MEGMSGFEAKPEELKYESERLWLTKTDVCDVNNVEAGHFPGQGVASDPII